MSETKNILEVEHLCQYFTSGHGRKKLTVKAVDDVSFSVRQAETFGLVGESGCGKTTTGRAIIRLYNPTSGTMRFDGREISGKMNRSLSEYLSQNIAMIFQDPIESLNPRMTIEEIVGESLRLRGMSKEEAHRQVIAMLDKVGLTEEHATCYPHEFSGGQRQRVGIARAMIVRPRLIIADEPVSALDVSIQAQVINLLNDLKQDLGLTILFIAHNLSVVKYFSDRIGVMYYGKWWNWRTATTCTAIPCIPIPAPCSPPFPSPILSRKENAAGWITCRSAIMIIQRRSPKCGKWSRSISYTALRPNGNITERN